MCLIAGQAYGPFFAALDYMLNGTPVGILIGSIPYASDILSALPVLWLFWTAIVQLLPGIQSKLKHWPRTKAWGLLKKWSGLEFVWNFLHQNCIKNGATASECVSELERGTCCSWVLAQSLSYKWFLRSSVWDLLWRRSSPNLVQPKFLAAIHAL